MGLHNHKRRENNCVVERKRSYTNGVCEKNIVDWASNHIDTTTIESCRDYLGKSNSFQEQHT
jgi:hypothetical protein